MHDEEYNPDEHEDSIYENADENVDDDKASSAEAAFVRGFEAGYEEEEDEESSDDDEEYEAAFENN